jgi:hypothetical protein
MRCIDVNSILYQSLLQIRINLAKETEHNGMRAECFIQMVKLANKMVCQIGLVSLFTNVRNELFRIGKVESKLHE